MKRTRYWAAAAVLLLAPAVCAGPIRVSFLNTDAARENTLNEFEKAGCEPNRLDALRKAILHYYRTPLALDTSSFPAHRDGFYEFASIGDFVSALGTNQISFLPHAFELNCTDTALLLGAPAMQTTANLQAKDAPYLAVQVTANYSEWLAPVASLGDIAAIAYPPWYLSWMKETAQFELPEKHKTLAAALYQYQTLPLGTTAETISTETRDALQRHWKRCGIQFPANPSLVMLHRASTNYHLVVTDHMGALLKRKNGYLYLEKTGGHGPFLRIDVDDPADIATYFSTMTFPDYPFNYLSVNDGLFLNVPLKPRATPPAPATADRAKQAIQRRYFERPLEMLDARGYVPCAELNLLPGVRLEDIQGDFAQGSGNELAGKFRATHSSSALAANTFGPWRKNPQALSLLGKTGFTSLQFERQCPTGLGGIPPNLDLVIEGTDVVIGVESKFLEFLALKQPTFTDSYKPENLPRMESCWAELMAALKAGPEQYLDGAQLVRHYLGLRNQPEFKGKKIILLNIFWEPENWADFPEYRRHRAELAAFQEAVKDSEVAFLYMSYPELWNQWEALGLSPDHLREIRKRYLLSI